MAMEQIKLEFKHNERIFAAHYDDKGRLDMVKNAITGEVLIINVILNTRVSKAKIATLGGMYRVKSTYALIVDLNVYIPYYIYHDPMIKPAKNTT
jgi:hypothetical protein